MTHFGRNHFRSIIFLLISAILLFGLLYTLYFRIAPQPLPLPAQAPPLNNAVRHRTTNSYGPNRIGIVSGHLGTDSGAICESGLTEQQVNLGISEQVVNQLRTLGYQADLLSENDLALTGYSALALVHIHADSCIPGLSGFKMASSGTQQASQLQSCLFDRYSQATQLPNDPNRITPDMTHNHAFDKIQQSTPAVILEAGYLSDDQYLLTTNSSIVAQGIVNGITCYAELAQ